MTSNATIEADKQLASAQAVLPELPWDIVEFKDYSNLDFVELGDVYDKEFESIGPAKNRTKKFAFDGLTVVLKKDEDKFYPFGSRYEQWTIDKKLTLTRDDNDSTHDLAFNRRLYNDSVTCNAVSLIVSTAVASKVEVETDPSLGALVGMAVKLDPVTVANSKEKYMKDTNKDKKIFGLGINILRLLNEQNTK